jgi:hypothetical protein
LRSFLFAYIFLFVALLNAAASEPEKVQIIENIPAVSNYAWWIDGKASVNCSGSSCTAYISPPASGSNDVHGAILKLLRKNGTIVVAQCLAKERVGADVLADLSGVAHSKTYRDCRMPEPGNREIKAEFSTAAVKLTFTNPRSDASGRIFTETYLIKGFLNPVSAGGETMSMSFQPEEGDRGLACGPLKSRMKVHTDKGQHPLGSMAPGSALVYVIQEHQMTVKVLGSFPTRIALDGQWVGGNHSESYFFFPVSGGDHQICAEWEIEFRNHMLPVSLAKFSAEPGQTYFLRERVTFAGLDGERSIKLEPISEEEGKSLMLRLPYSEQK